MLITLARFYTTLSLALLPAALVVLGLMIAGFKETGPQSNGLGTLVLIAGSILVGLFINATLAGIAAWRWPGVRTTFARVALMTAALLALAAALHGVLSLP